jgi:NTE family protein
MKKPVFGVFEGGGIKGVALAGAAAAVLDSGYRFERVAGTSAGALTASLIAADYTADELRRLVARINWPSLLDGVPGLNIPVFGKHIAFLRKGGLYRGAQLQRVWGQLLAAKGISTFGDLETGRLRMVAVDLSHERGVVLPDGLEEYGIDAGRFPIARAVRMSSAVPFIFKPVELQNRFTGDVSLMADGSLGSKFPVELVDQRSDTPVIGFRPVDVEDIHRHNEVRGPASLAAAVMTTGMSARETLPRGRFESVHQILVPTKRDSLDFNLTSKQALVMFDEGYVSGTRFLAQTEMATL